MCGGGDVHVRANGDRMQEEDDKFSAPHYSANIDRHRLLASVLPLLLLLRRGNDATRQVAVNVVFVTPNLKYDDSGLMACRGGNMI